MSIISKLIALNYPFNEQRWNAAFISLTLCLLVLLVAFFGTFKSIVLTWWQSGTYTHGFLITPIVAYLIWDKRSSLKRMSPNPQKKAMLLVCIFLLTWVIANLLNLIVIMQFSVVALVVALTWMFLGSAVVAKLTFPLGFLFFAVPFGDFLVPTLQDITAIFSVKALQLSSIPVYLEGRYFYIPSGSFEVAEGCSGVRYLIASISLGTLYSYLFINSIKRRILFIAFCAVVPILANAIRAYGIVMIAHLSNYRLAVGVDHIIYGWVFFGLVLIFVFWVGSFFRDSNVVRTAPQTNHYDPKNTKSANYLPLTLIASLMIVSCSLLASWFNSVPNNLIAPVMEFPKGQFNWEGPIVASSMWHPLYRGASIEQKVKYKSKYNEIEVYIGYYLLQKQGAELINTQNKLYSSEWKRISDSTLTISGLDVGDWGINEVVISAEDEKRIIWYWYSVGGYHATNFITAKLFELPARLLHQDGGSAIVAISTPYEVEIDSGRHLLKGFLKKMLLPLNTMVNQQELLAIDK